MRTRTLGRLLVGVGVLAAVAALLAAVVGLRLLSALDTALEASLSVTGDAVASLTDTVTLLDDTVVEVESALGSAAAATEDVAVSLGDARDLLGATARLTRDEVAGSLAAVDATLPALIDTASVVDATLGALAILPFGPDYDPDQPFDDALREVQVELGALPDAVRRQADLLDDSASDLSAVAVSTRLVGNDLRGLAATLSEASTLLERYATTAAEADLLLSSTADDLGSELTAARVLVVVLGGTGVLAQLVPIGLGWLLLDPDRLRELLRPQGDAATPAPA